VKPVAFSEQNIVYGEGQDEYLPLPAHRGLLPHVVVTSCWQLTDDEIAELISNGGRIWLQQFTFNDPLQPQLASVFKPHLV
jgi:hypothetical protein